MNGAADCPRCGAHGNMIRYVDSFGEYDGCLMCGYHREVLSGPPIQRTIAAKRMHRDPAHKGRRL